MTAYLQSHVVPVCAVSVIRGEAKIVRHFGSAFFVDQEGHFLTARHVMQLADDFSRAEGTNTMLIAKADRGNSGQSIAAFIREWVPAPEPNDIALGVTRNYQCDSGWSSYQGEIKPWNDVATFGYPESAVTGNVGALQMNIRCLKGYVQRILSPGEIPLRADSPPAFEISFLISPGFSGSPLFSTTAPLYEDLIGICVSSFSSELVDHSVTEIQQDGSSLTEKRTRIEQFGCAEDLRPLLDWKPELLSGRPLRAVMKK